jgi:hypothetical protein
MAASARVFDSLPNKQHERLTQLADAKGLSISGVFTDSSKLVRFFVDKFEPSHPPATVA